MIACCVKLVAGVGRTGALIPLALRRPTQTGSGKTHSLLSQGAGDLSQAGLLPRVAAALYVHIAGDTKHVYSIEAAMLQIYNEKACPASKESGLEKCHLCRNRINNCKFRAGHAVQRNLELISNSVK